MIMNLIDHIEIYILEIFAEIAMHLFIRDIRDKQFDLELSRIYQLEKYYDLTASKEQF